MSKYIIVLFLLGVVSSGCSSDGQRVIGIQPYGSVEKTLVDSVASALSKEYDIKIVQLPSKPLPSHAFINVKSPRYRADKLIAHLRDTRPDSIDHVLAITNVDISTTRRNQFGQTLEPASKYEDFGIFGLGYTPGPSCIMSTYRTQNKTSRANFMLRMKKIAVHEIGHNLGLCHCKSERCVMQDAAESIATIDYVTCSLCRTCRAKIED